MGISALGVRDLEQKYENQIERGDEGNSPTPIYLLKDLLNEIRKVVAIKLFQEVC